MIDPDTGRVVYVLDASKVMVYYTVEDCSKATGVTPEVIISDCSVPLNSVMPEDFPRFLITTAIPA